MLYWSIENFRERHIKILQIIAEKGTTKKKNARQPLQRSLLKLRKLPAPYKDAVDPVFLPPNLLGVRFYNTSWREIFLGKCLEITSIVQKYGFDVLLLPKFGIKYIFELKKAQKKKFFASLTFHGNARFSKVMESIGTFNRYCRKY